MTKTKWRTNWRRNCLHQRALISVTICYFYFIIFFVIKCYFFHLEDRKRSYETSYVYSHQPAPTYPSHYPAMTVDFTPIFLAIVPIALFVGAAAAFALSTASSSNSAVATANQQQQQQEDNNNNNNALNNNNNNNNNALLAAVILASSYGGGGYKKNYCSYCNNCTYCSNCTSYCSTNTCSYCNYGRSLKNNKLFRLGWILIMYLWIFCKIYFMLNMLCKE